MDEILLRTRQWIDRLLDSDDYEPRGKFICADEVDGEDVWVAVDNSNGEAITEEFTSRYAATTWLRGRRIRNRFGEMLNAD